MSTCVDPAAVSPSTVFHGGHRRHQGDRPGVITDAEYVIDGGSLRTV